MKPTFLVCGGRTIVASAVATDPPYGADRTGRRDATAAIQRAVDDVAAAGGGVVFLPAGRYRIETSLRIGYAVTLSGEPAAPEPGTLLLALGGQGEPTAPALIQAPAAEAGLLDLGIWYPEQHPDAVVPYPPTVASGQITLRNVTFWNSYEAVALKAANACVLENLRGTVLHRGISAPMSTEFSWMRDVHFANRTWREAARMLSGEAFTSVQSAALDRFTTQHLVGLELRRIDGMALYRFRADDAKTPIRMVKNPEFPHPVHGFGGVMGGCSPRREEEGWAPWYYGMHFANLDNVPETRGMAYEFARIPGPRRTDPASFFDVTAASYGAVGDGKADDTEALRKALAAAGARGGGTVYLPQGEYRVSGPLVVPPGVELRGAMGTGKMREYREACTLSAAFGAGTPTPETDPALLTLSDHSGVRGFTIAHPEQAYDVKELKPYPYAIRGKGKGVWIADMMLLNAYHGIDLATHRCDDHLVAGVWATAFHKGIRVGGGSRGGRLERLAFSYGPWAEAGRLVGRKTPEGKKDLADYCSRNSVHYTFADCVGERAWGLVGFLPDIHIHFTRDRDRGCVDAELWMSLLDVARRGNVVVEAGERIRLVGFFGTGGGDGEHNWLELGPAFTGPLDVYAKTIQQLYINRPLAATPDQVRFFEEESLTTGKPATAEGSRPEFAVDRDPRTYWEAPGGSMLQVDLGSVRVIDRFALQSAGLFHDLAWNAVEAELEVSLDGKSFATAGKLSARPGGARQRHVYSWADVPVEPVRARLVRLRVTDPGGDGRIRVSSFSVFGPTNRWPAPAAPGLAD